MKKLPFFCTAVALLLLTQIATPPSAQTSLAEETQTPEQQAAVSSDYDYSMAAPEFIVDNTTYVLCTRYEWRAGAGGDRIAMSRYPNTNFSVVADSNYYVEYSFPNHSATDSYTLCLPQDYYYRTCNSTTGDLSYRYATSEHKAHGVAPDGYEYNGPEYGYHCALPVTEIFDNYWKTVPTEFDKDGFIWQHKSSGTPIIVATIEYENVAYNIRVGIPWLGTRTTNVIIKGVTFSLRTGPNKCSIKCNQSGIYLGHFAFTTVTDDKSAELGEKYNFVGS